MDAMRNFAEKVATKFGASADSVQYITRLVTNKIMLISVATIALSSILFSPFFPLYWLTLAGSVVGIVTSVHQTDKAIEAEKAHPNPEKTSTASSAGVASSENTWDWSNISLSKILSSILS
ncbi:MAG: hypothetical protein LBD72_00450 [Puniceicoccales bacterium]|jgi:hypothetical protein|nr:hypothetical protein [Puniceicoccales bacterium]